MWLVPRIDSPSETSAGSMLTGSDEAAKTMVPPCWLPPPAPPPDPFSSPHAVATSASAANRTSRRIPRGRCNAPTSHPGRRRRHPVSARLDRTGVPGRNASVLDGLELLERLAAAVAPEHRPAEGRAEEVFEGGVGRPAPRAAGRRARAAACG